MIRAVASFLSFLAYRIDTKRLNPIGFVWLRSPFKTRTWNLKTRSSTAPHLASHGDFRVSSFELPASTFQPGCASAAFEFSISEFKSAPTLRMAPPNISHLYATRCSRTCQGKVICRGIEGNLYLEFRFFSRAGRRISLYSAINSSSVAPTTRSSGPDPSRRRAWLMV